MSEEAPRIRAAPGERGSGPGGRGQSTRSAGRASGRPVEEALSILEQASPDEPIAAYLRKILASPGLEHG